MFLIISYFPSLPSLSFSLVPPLPPSPFTFIQGDGAKAVTREVSEGDTVPVGSLSVQVIETPFHTRGHVCYYLDAEGDRAVFTGDTLL